MDVYENDQLVAEIDLCAIVRGQIVTGEAKTTDCSTRRARMQM